MNGTDLFQVVLTLPFYSSPSTFSASTGVDERVLLFLLIKKTQTPNFSGQCHSKRHVLTFEILILWKKISLFS